MDIEVLTPPVQHAESPFWNSKNQSLYFVDTFQALVLKWDGHSKNVTSHQLKAKAVGFLVPIKNMLDTYILCKDRDVCIFHWDGMRNDSGTLNYLLKIEQDKEFNQFNDGKADAYGRLWAGTLTRNNDLSVANEGGSLYSIEDNFGIFVKNKISPVSISNGLAWSSDKKNFFYIDSATRRIMKYNFDLTEGVIGQPETLFNISLYKNLKGIPDGMTIDTDDNLWIALFGGKAVIKINSTNGKLMLVKNLPATYVTSATFGGPAYSVLYVTTSRLKLSDSDMMDEPNAGSVFAVHSLGVKGIPPDTFILRSKLQ